MSEDNERDSSPIGALEIAILLIVVVLQLVLQNYIPSQHQGPMFLFLLAVGFVVIAYARNKLKEKTPTSSGQKVTSPITQNIVNILGGKVDEIVQSQSKNTTNLQYNIEIENIVSQVQSDPYLSNQGKEEIISKIQSIKVEYEKPEINKSKVQEITDWLREKAPKWILEALIKIGISRFPDLIDFFNSLL